jgi:hypothetical protein
VRWAILGTPAMQDTGLTDLLHVRLASLDGVQLVEREQLQAIAAEYSLETLGAAGAVRQRLRLGSVLRADRLLLLSRTAQPEPADDATEILRLVIADCGTGARIGHENIRPTSTRKRLLMQRPPQSSRCGAGSRPA